MANVLANTSSKHGATSHSFGAVFVSVWWIPIFTLVLASNSSWEQVGCWSFSVFLSLWVIPFTYTFYTTVYLLKGPNQPDTHINTFAWYKCRYKLVSHSCLMPHSWATPVKSALTCKFSSFRWCFISLPVSISAPVSKQSGVSMNRSALPRGRVSVAPGEELERGFWAQQRQRGHSMQLVSQDKLREW